MDIYQGSNYPNHDPTWDYAQLYELAIALEQESTTLRTIISNAENRTPEADARIHREFSEVLLRCSELVKQLR